VILYTYMCRTGQLLTVTCPVRLIVYWLTFGLTFTCYINPSRNHETSTEHQTTCYTTTRQNSVSTVKSSSQKSTSAAKTSSSSQKKQTSSKRSSTRGHRKSTMTVRRSTRINKNSTLAAKSSSGDQRKSTRWLKKTPSYRRKCSRGGNRTTDVVRLHESTSVTPKKSSTIQRNVNKWSSDVVTTTSYFDDYGDNTTMKIDDDY